MRRPEHISLLARKNEAKKLTEERVVREGETAFRRVKEDGPSGVVEYGFKFRPVIE